MFNGGLKITGTVRIRGLTYFRDVNQEKVNTVLVTVAY